MTTTTSTSNSTTTATDDYNPKYGVAGDDDMVVPAAPTDDGGSDDAGEHPVGKRHKKNQENRDTGDDDIANPMNDDADSHAIFGKSKSTTKATPAIKKMDQTAAGDTGDDDIANPMND